MRCCSRLSNFDGRAIGARAFTLIELLVVLGIIAILAALLIPAVSAARGKAADAKCIANLRGFGLGIQQYASENQMRLPPGSTPGNQWFKAGPGSWVRDYMMDGTRQDFPSFYRCPRDHTVSTYRFYYSYTWNSAALLPYDNLSTPSKGKKPVLLWQVNRTILMADGLSEAEDSSIGRYPARIVPANAKERLSRRHRGGLNALFGDGSVKWMEIAEAALPENLLPDN